MRERSTSSLATRRKPLGLRYTARAKHHRLPFGGVRDASSAASTQRACSPISSSTGQHLVDSDNVERVNPDPQVESLLSGSLDNVLVGANSSSFKSFRRKLLVLVRDEMATEGEVVDIGPLSSQVEDSDLGVGNTTVVS